MAALLGPSAEPVERAAEDWLTLLSTRNAEFSRWLVSHFSRHQMDFLANNLNQYPAMAEQLIHEAVSADSITVARILFLELSRDDLGRAAILDILRPYLGAFVERRAEALGETTVLLPVAARKAGGWASEWSEVRSELDRFLFGATPLRRAVQMAAERF